MMGQVGVLKPFFGHALLTGAWWFRGRCGATWVGGRDRTIAMCVFVFLLFVFLFLFLFLCVFRVFKMSSFLSGFVFFCLLLLFSVGLEVENRLDVELACVINVGTLVVKPQQTLTVFGNGRCADVVNDGNRTLFEWNVVEDMIYYDISLVDACTFDAIVYLNAVESYYVKCGCSSISKIVSDCTKFRTNEYCCLNEYGNAKTCKIDGDYYKKMTKCSKGVYKYAYDDETSLHTCTIHDNVKVVIFSNHGTESPVRQNSYVSAGILKQSTYAIIRCFVYLCNTWFLLYNCC
ncbi:putative protein P33 [Pistachio ampelovirus A]|uniref:Uncharacterized protein n=1 Tax=Pistachio ampelovirus A TaxID=2093224 RepID=A0A499Q1W1_9CLOS|nr:putative protein P33 [Pistachio ampelovirus A]AVN99309.1 putative protein P33 [Pistachio ampelovirus A]